MRLKKLIARFDFTNQVRNKITLGVGVRLDVADQYLKLIDVAGVYPLTDDLYAKTWIINPNNVKQWLGFECVVENAHDDEDKTWLVTGTNFRLHNGTNEYWYNGTTWAISTTKWNTEVDIANHINTFPVTLKKIGVVINLYTSDITKTPIVKAVKILYSSDVEHQDDYLYRTIIKQLKTQILPITDYPITLVDDSVEIDLKNDFPLETPYVIGGIDSVFNHTDDPDHFVDLYQSYDSPTQIITLSSSIASGKIVWIKLIYCPVIAVTTGLEYYELEKVPAIILGDINLTNKMELSYSDVVMNKSTMKGVKIFPPQRQDMEITLSIVTDNARDQTRVADELKRFFVNNPVLTSWGTGEEFTLLLLSDYVSQGTIPADGIQTGKLRFSLLGTLYYEQDAVDVYAIANFKITGDVNVTVLTQGD
jgi:hypothetical protein